jgi:hypothetical protein
MMQAQLSVSQEFWSSGLTVMLRPQRLQRDWVRLQVGHSVTAVLEVLAEQLEQEPALGLAGSGIFWQKLQVIFVPLDCWISQRVILPHPLSMRIQQQIERLKRKDVNPAF